MRRGTPCKAVRSTWRGSFLDPYLIGENVHLVAQGDARPRDGIRAGRTIRLRWWVVFKQARKSCDNGDLWHEERSGREGAIVK